MKFILTALIPIVFSIIGLVIINNTTKPTVTHVSAGNGLPEQYNIEASSKYKFEHGGSNRALIILAYFLFVGGAVVEYILDNKALNGGKGIAIVTWIIGFILIFIPLAVVYGNSKYVKTISVEQYETNKADLNKLFE